MSIENNNRHDIPSYVLHEAIGQDSRIIDAQTKAQEWQTILTELVQANTLTDEDLEQAITELDTSTELVDRELIISGHVTLKDISPLEIEAGERLMEGRQETVEFLVNTPAKFLGHTALRSYSGDAEAIRIEQLAIPTYYEEMLAIPNVGRILQQNIYHLPIDGSVDVKIIDSIPEQYAAELMTLYAPSLTDQIDQAIYNHTDNRTQMLRHLSRVNLDELKTKAYETLAPIVRTYVNQASLPRSNVPHRISGFQYAYIPHNDQVVAARIPTGTKMVGFPVGIDVVDDEGSIFFTLDMILPFDDSSNRVVKIPLNSRMYLKKYDEFSIG